MPRRQGLRAGRRLHGPVRERQGQRDRVRRRDHDEAAEGRHAPACDADWLRQAASLLGRASVALERCGATATLARLDEVIAEVDELVGTELV